MSILNKHALPDLRHAFTASTRVKHYYMEYLLGITSPFRLILGIEILLGLVQAFDFRILVEFSEKLWEMWGWLTPVFMKLPLYTILQVSS